MHMKSFLIIIMVSAIFASCTGNQIARVETSETSADLENKLTNYCFQRVEGTTKQDTSTIQLLINGEEVTGNFNHIPFEKDSRKGTIKGIKDGDTIKALWSFMQEGMNDTLSVEFKLSDDLLLQKTFGIDQTTGRQILTDTSTFSIRYSKIDCEMLK